MRSAADWGVFLSGDKLRSSFGVVRLLVLWLVPIGWRRRYVAHQYFLNGVRLTYVSCRQRLRWVLRSATAFFRSGRRTAKLRVRGARPVSVRSIMLATPPAALPGPPMNAVLLPRLLTGEAARISGSKVRVLVRPPNFPNILNRLQRQSRSAFVPTADIIISSSDALSAGVRNADL
jgi:hypothetical protein